MYECDLGPCKRIFNWNVKFFRCRKTKRIVDIDNRWLQHEKFNWFEYAKIWIKTSFVFCRCEFLLKFDEKIAKKLKNQAIL